jgi:non-specific serine/threonine protein kinase
MATHVTAAATAEATRNAATPPDFRRAAPRRRIRVAVVFAAVLLGAACTGSDEPASPIPVPTASGDLAWRALPDAPSARTEVAAAAVGGTIYVIGGFRGDGSTVAAVEAFDTATGRWSTGPDLPAAVNHAMATTVADSIHVFGGFLPGGDPSAAAFRLRSGAWEVISPLPDARAAGTAVALGETVYVAGGVGADGLASRMLVYDAATDTWSAAPGPPTPREHLGGAGFAGRVYTVGGRRGGVNSILGAVEAYDPGSGRWSRLPDLPTPRGGLAAAASCTGHVVAVGGEASSTFHEAEAFHVRDGSWRALPGLPTPRHGLGAVAVGSVLYTLAGGPQPGLHVAASTEAIDLRPLGACPTPPAG